MVDTMIPTYQSTSYKKNDSGAIVYIALASLGALVIILGALYFMFFNNGEESVNVAHSNGQVIKENDSSAMNNTGGAITSTPTVSVSPSASNTPTPTVTQTITPTPQDQGNTIDTNFIYGVSEDSNYKINAESLAIIDKSDNSAVYKAPSGYSLISFAIAKPYIYVVLKTPEAYTYDFRKVRVGSNNLGSLFYTYYSAYAMTSFVVDPANYKTTDTYIILSSLSKKQFLVLDIKNFKEAGKKVVGAPNYASFKSAYKLADQNAIKIEYTTSSGDTSTVIVSFED